MLRDMEPIYLGRNAATNGKNLPVGSVDFSGRA